MQTAGAVSLDRVPPLAPLAVVALWFMARSSSA
jgi:hypothetical protein